MFNGGSYGDFIFCLVDTNIFMVLIIFWGGVVNCGAVFFSGPKGETRIFGGGKLATGHHKQTVEMTHSAWLQL